VLVESQVVVLTICSATRAVLSHSRELRTHSEQARAGRRAWRERELELQGTWVSTRLLVLCMQCGRFRGSDGQWRVLPSGASRVIGAWRTFDVSHGLCGECLNTAEAELRLTELASASGPRPLIGTGGAADPC
jgi:hypothetical protein